MSTLPRELERALQNPLGERFLSLGDAAEVPPEIAALENLESLSIIARWSEGKQLALDLPPQLGALRKLRALTLFTPLPSLPAVVTELPALESLTVIFSKPEAGEALLALPALRELDVRPLDDQPEGTAIDVPAWLPRLTRLRALTLTGRFTAVPDELAALTELESLDLGGVHGLPVIPPGVTRLLRLRSLKIHAHAIPAEIAALAMLEELVMTSCGLATLPAEIGRLARLRKLDLSLTPLAALPAELGELASLQSLSLRMNQLERLPPEIGRLRALRTLDLAGNPLVELPDEIGDLAALERLDLGHDERLPRGLRALPATIGRLANLEVIWATNGRLEALPPEIGGCARLRTLYLNDLRIARIPPEIGELKRLSWLHLKNNPLRSLPAELERCAALTELELAGCTFPPEAFDVVERIARRPGMSAFSRPRLDEALPPIPATASPARLAPAVLAEIARLGGRVESPAELPPTPRETTRRGDWPVPEAIRQLGRDVRWPAATFAGSIDGHDVWLVRFGIVADLSEYECSYYHPYAGLGQTDGGNYALLVDLSDPDPSDPAVYLLDHESWSEPDARRLCDRLSAFLSTLAPEE